MGSRMQSDPRWSERIMTVCSLQWWWRNHEIFKGIRLELQERLKMVGERLGEVEALQQMEFLCPLERPGYARGSSSIEEM